MLLNLLLIWSFEMGMKGQTNIIEQPEINPVEYIIPEIGININGLIFSGFAELEGDIIMQEYFKFNYGFKILAYQDFFNFGLIYTFDNINKSDEIKIFMKIQSIQK